MSRMIEDRGFRCSLLEPNGTVDSEDGGAGTDPALDQASDAQQTISQTDPVDWLIVDNYAIDHRWERAMRSLCRRLLVMDDLADRQHDCDILLDQTFGCEANQYRSLVAPECKVLTGADFALLRPEFAAKRSAALARRQQYDGVRSVLVSMGGSDPENQTLEAVRALAGTPGSEGLAVTVVTGAQYAHGDASLTALAGSFERLAVRQNVSDMAELMATADLAIGAAGTTSWERCCLGLPALIYIYADNQREIARSLEDAGAVRVWRSVAELQEHVEAFMNDVSLYRSAVSAAADICDGRGVDRVVSVMQSC